MQQGISAPPGFDSAVSSEALLIGWVLLCAIGAGISIWVAVRERDILPLTACVGAFVCTLNEPIFDVLAKLVYPDNLDVAYSAFGRDIPWTLVVGYLPWVGLMPYLLYRLMASGAPRAQLHKIAAGLIGSVALVELLNATWLHAWKYYGETAWRGVLGGGIMQMAAMPLVCALLYYLLADRMTGWRRASMGLIVPAVSLPLVFGATTWPLYFSNYTKLPAAVDWIAAGLTIALCLLAIPIITRIAQRWHAGEALLGPGNGRQARSADGRGVRDGEPDRPLAGVS
jgi:hypothetical protein